MSVSARSECLVIVAVVSIVSLASSRLTSASDRALACVEQLPTPNAAKAPAAVRPADALPEIVGAFHVGDRPVTAIAFAGEGETLVVAEAGPARRDAGDPGRVLLYDLSGEEPRLSGSLDATADYVAGLASSPKSGRWLATGSVRWDQRLGLFQKDDGRLKLVQSLPSPSKWWLNSLAFSPDDRYLATVSGSPAGPIQLWTVSADGLAKDKVLPGPAWAASAIAFSPDGRFLAAGLGSGHRHPRDGEILVWDMSPNEPRLTFQSAGGDAPRKRTGTDVKAIAWLPKGDALAAAYQDGGVVFFRATDEGRLEQTADVSGGRPLQSMGLFAGRFVLTSGDDGAITCWSARGERLRRWKVGAGVTLLAVSPSGRHVGIGLPDGAVYLEFR